MSDSTQPETQLREIWQTMTYSIIVPNLNNFTYDELEALFKDALNSVALDRGDVE